MIFTNACLPPTFADDGAFVQTQNVVAAGSTVKLTAKNAELGMFLDYTILLSVPAHYILGKNTRLQSDNFFGYTSGDPVPFASEITTCELFLDMISIVIEHYSTAQSYSVPATTMTQSGNVISEWFP